MKSNSKGITRRIISILLTVCLTVCCVPVRAFAWKNLTHVTSANLILLEMLRSSGGEITIYAPYGSGEAYTYTVPEEYCEALKKYPEAFRAGSMGPDFYPDMLTGQGYIHPYDKDAGVSSGEWITLLCSSVNMMPKDSEERKRALSFTLGFMLHYCGDIFGHDFVNQFAGGNFPSAAEALSSDRDLNIMLSHMSEETYLDSKVNWDFFNACNMLDIDAPIEFITDTMLYDGTKSNGSAQIYRKYGSVPAIYEYLINLRAYLYEKAEEMRKSSDPAQDVAVMYLDAWIEDLDTAVDALVRCFNSMANRMVTEKGPDMVNIIVDEVTAWFDEYGRYITPLPDLAVDLTVEGSKALVEEAVKSFEFVQNTDEMKSEQIRSLSLSHIGIPGLDEKIREYTERMNNPAVQLDYSTNPFSPANKEEGGNFREFDAFVSAFANEEAGLKQISYADIFNGTDGGALDRAIDSDFDAFYNTIAMFKLILIGPDNFSDFIKKVSNADQAQYRKNTAELCATSLEFDIKTADTPAAGTDDNIFALVYDKEKSESVPVIKKLLDKSGKNDFECGRKDNYTVELGSAVKLSNIEVEIKQESTGSIAPEWDCESIAITPFHAGVALIRPLGFGGRYGMKDGDTWNLCFHDELVLRTQISDKWNTLGALSANLVIETGTADNAGTDDNVTLDVYNGTGLVKSILLDKYYCDDFEAGSRDTYSVPLADNLKEAIPPEVLNMKLTCSGNAAGDAWDVSSLSITLFHGEIQLTDTVNRGPKNLYNSTWDLGITDDMRRKECTLKPLALSYETNVGDGMLDFVYSLDGSHQYVNSKGPLWGDTAIRREVFFRIFKGFSPDIEYAGEEKEVTEGQAFDLDFTLEGMWNGTGHSRRDQVYFNPNSTPGNSDDYPSMPTVSGNATISFIDSNKSVVCSVRQKVSNGEIQLRDYKNDSLTAGTYSLKVKYDPDSTDPMYAAAEEVFNDKLTVIVTGCAHEHTEIRNAVQADCVTRGYSGDEYCTDCGSRVKKGHSTDVDPDRHDPDKGVITREATHLSDGVRTSTCRNCGRIFAEAIPRLTDDDDSNTLVEDVKKMNGEAAISENVLRREEGGTETRVIIDGKEVSRIVKDAEGNAVEVKTVLWTGGLMDSYRYTGSAIKPVFHVYDGAKLLREKTDYSVGFKNNKKAGADADVTIRFKGNYKGTEVKHFHIEPAVIGEDVIIYDTSVAKTGREIKPALDVLWAGTGKKVSPKEFKFECGADIRDTGVYSVSVAPRDVSPNFTKAEGFKTRGVLVVTDKANLLSGASVKLDPKQKYYYTGDEIVPKKGSYTLTLNGSDLEEGKDYVVDSVRNNVDPGTATIVFRAVKADYNAVSGMKTASFKIQKVRDILNEEGFVVTCSDAVPYAKGGPKPDITVSYGGRRLKAGKDYAVKYGKNTSVTGGKTAEITVSGKGNFKGKKTLNYSVERQDLAVLSANILVNDVTGSGGTYGKPVVTVTDLNGKALKAGTDFELRNYAQQDGGNEVTVDVAGIGNYEGTVSATFRVIEKDQQIGRLKAERVSDRIYTGEKVTLTEKDLRTLLFTGEKNNSEYLAPGTDFEVAAYSNNLNTGTARVTLRGLGKYGGTKTITFKIIRRSRQ